MLFVALCAFGLSLGSCPDDAAIVESESAAAGFEVCGLDVNGGCATGGSFIEAGAAPFVACGELFVGDVDAYRFTLDERAHVSVSIDAAFGARAVLMSSDACDEQFTLIDLTHAGGEATEAGGVVNAGAYEVRVMGADGEVLECGGYVLGVGVDPLGSCCSCDGEFNGCTYFTESRCHETGGRWCPDNPCWGSGYEIRPNGNEGDTAFEPGFYETLTNPVFDLSDEIRVLYGVRRLDFRDGEPIVVALSGPDSDLINYFGDPFEVPFRYFGTVRERIAISPNGRISFPIDDVAPPVSAPGVGGPAFDFVAPYWTDLDLSAGGSVLIVAFGSHPFREITIEFVEVPGAENPDVLHSFRVELSESTMIWFRYRSLPPSHEDAFIGLVGPDGATVGFSPELLSSLDTSILGEFEGYRVQFLPEYIGNCCPEDVDTVEGECNGDCRPDGEVNFDDIFKMLFNFGEAYCSSCDVNNDLVVDYNDMVAALFLFGPCPQ